jgi:hypothetical protein
MRLIRRERLAGDLRTSAPAPGYRWIALSNTTLGTLMATINGSIILIALPDIFRGIGVNPLLPRSHCSGAEHTCTAPPDAPARPTMEKAASSRPQGPHRR